MKARAWDLKKKNFEALTRVSVSPAYQDFG
jgi:hypothetical protein